MKTIMVIMILSLFPVRTGLECRSIVKPYSQEQAVMVTPFNFPQMPLRLNTTTVQSLTASCWLTYSVTNLASDKIREIHFRVFLADSEGKLSTTLDATSLEPIAIGVTQNGRTLIQETIEAKGVAFIAVTKAVGSAGVWTVNDESLEKAVRAKLTHQTETNVSVEYESHKVLTDEDRSQIFRLVLEDLLRDETKVKRLGDHSRVILLRESANFSLPQIRGTALISLEHDEIRKIADREGRVVFITYQPLASEGSRVIATLILRDEVARRQSIHIPYKFTFQYSCRNKGGRWIIERSIRHS